MHKIVVKLCVINHMACFLLCFDNHCIQIPRSLSSDLNTIKDYVSYMAPLKIL